MAFHVPLVVVLSGDDLLIGLFGEPLGCGKIGVVTGVDVLGWLLGDRYSSSYSDAATSNLSRVLIMHFSFEFSDTHSQLTNEPMLFGDKQLSQTLGGRDAVSTAPSVS